MPRPASEGIHLVLVHTEGKPYDLGKPLVREAEKISLLAERVFSSVHIFTPRQLISQGILSRESFCDYSERIENDLASHPSFRWNRHWAQLGFLQWKPQVISHVLELGTVRENDIIFYHDADCGKYPEYLLGIRSWPKWLSSNMKNADVLAFDDNRAPIYSDTKKELLDKFVPAELQERVSHRWAGAIAVRKNPSGKEFLGLWIQHCTFENLSPVTNHGARPGFVHNSGEQSVLSALWHSGLLEKAGIRGNSVYLQKSRRIPPRQKRGKRLRRVIQSVCSLK